MENSLVNPWWIYLIDLFSNADALMWVSVVVCAVICILATIIFLCETSDGFLDEDDKLYGILKKAIKTSIVVGIITMIIGSVIPSEKTMYTMFVSSYLTEENITNATESVTDVVDYIFEKVDQLQND
jgi:phage-related protein